MSSKKSNVNYLEDQFSSAFFYANEVVGAWAASGKPAYECCDCQGQGHKPFCHDFAAYLLLENKRFVTEALQKFCALATSPTVVDHMNRCLFDPGYIKVQSRLAGNMVYTTPAAAMDELLPSAVNILRFTDETDLAQLKRNYHAAWAGNQEDVSAGEDALVLVNRSFRFAHHLLCHEFGPSANSMLETSMESHLYNHLLTLASAYSEFWSLEEAHQVLLLLRDSGFALAREPIKKVEFTNFCQLVGLVTTVVGQHAQAGQSEQAEELVDFLLAVSDQRLKVVRGKSNWPRYDWKARLANAQQAGKKPGRLQFKHPATAKNAMNLGVITPRQYTNQVLKLAVFENSSKEVKLLVPNELEREKFLGSSLEEAIALPDSSPEISVGQETVATAIENYWQGEKYFEGDGVPQDFEKAERCYRLAANQGVHEACHALGYMYMNGIGVDEDLERARSWFVKSLDEGSSIAAESLSTLAHREIYTFFEQKFESETDFWIAHVAEYVMNFLNTIDEIADAIVLGDNEDGAFMTGLFLEPGTGEFLDHLEEVNPCFSRDLSWFEDEYDRHVREFIGDNWAEIVKHRLDYETRSLDSDTFGKLRSFIVVLADAGIEFYTKHPDGGGPDFIEATVVTDLVHTDYASLDNIRSEIDCGPISEILADSNEPIFFVTFNYLLADGSPKIEFFGPEPNNPGITRLRESGRLNSLSSALKKLADELSIPMNIDLLPAEGPAVICFDITWRRKYPERFHDMKNH